LSDFVYEKNNPAIRLIRLLFSSLEPGLCHRGERRLFGHVSAPATERYLGCKQRIPGAANDRLGIEPFR